MNIHKNARLTPIGRERLVRLVESGQTPKAVSEAAGVCPRTVRKWVERYRREGLAGLRDRSSRPHCLHRPTPQAIVEQVERLRRQRYAGQQIAAELCISPATVSRILRRLGLNRLAALEPAEPVRRYEREHPGELIHIDIKKLGRFNRVGHRITGDRRGQSNSRGVGWEYVHICIDDASRIAYAEIKKNERKASAVAFLKAAVTYYAKLGVSIERVMTDNGSLLQNLAPSAEPASGSVSSTSEPGPIPRKPMARPSASSKPRSANGPTPRPTSIQIIAAPTSRSGSIATTGTVPMAASGPNRPSADSL